jgi:hypothetical protein
MESTDQGEGKMTDLSLHSLRVRGGATIPARGFPISASYPLAVLSADGMGVRVTLSPNWLRTLAGILRLDGRSSQSDTFANWTIDWRDLERAVCASRSVVLS